MQNALISDFIGKRSLKKKHITVSNGIMLSISRTLVPDSNIL